MEEVKLQLITKAIDEKKGENITVYDVSTTSPICSYIVIATIAISATATTAIMIGNKIFFFMARPFLCFDN